MTSMTEVEGTREPHLQADERYRLPSEIAQKNLDHFSYARKFRKRALECSIARNSIGNRSPVQKYVGAMLRSSIRVVLAAENDLVEVASDPDNFRFVTEVGQGGLPLYRTTENWSRFLCAISGGAHELENAAHVVLPW